MQPVRDRTSWYKRLIDDIKISAEAPDFWPTLGVFFGIVVVFSLFFWMALGFDVMSKIYGHWKGACRKLGDLQSLVLFVSPFAVGLSSLLAAGEFISQLERRNRFGKKIQWYKIATTFGFATAMLSFVAFLMVIWC